MCLPNILGARHYVLAWNSSLAICDSFRVSCSSQDSGSFEDSFEDAKYEFQYAVKDDFGNDFGHQEARDGDNTQGSYYVQLPDGRLQRVQYYVDGDSGYQAEVTYEGEARYDSVSRESRESRESYGYN